jgi:recombination protein RecA
MKKDWKNKLGQSWEPDLIIPSGSLKLDYSDALSNYHGIPSGSMVQISSAKEGCYKTTLALMGARELQRLGHKVVYIDAEAGLVGNDWIEGMGIKTDEDHWLYAQPETGEEAFEMAEYFITQTDYKGVIIDSIDACQPAKIMDSEFGDANIGNHAKLVTQAVRKFKTQVRVHQKFLWLVNQMKPHITNMGQRGNRTTGGFAIGFYCKLNLEMSRAKSDSQLIGDKHIPLKIRVARSKLGHGSWADIDTYAIQGHGFDKAAELVDYALDFNILKRAGSWYKLVENDEAIGQGIDAAKMWIYENEKIILDKIKDELDKEEKEINKEN